jgi:hypothetical protein
MRKIVKMSERIGNSKPHPFGMPFLCFEGKVIPMPP